MLISSMGDTLCHEWLRLKLEADLRRKMLRRLHEMPLSVLDGGQRGDWLTRMTGDLSQTELFLTLHDRLPKELIFQRELLISRL